jgi:hypothetical protein
MLNRESGEHPTAFLRMLEARPDFFTAYRFFKFWLIPPVMTNVQEVVQQALIT